MLRIHLFGTIEVRNGNQLIAPLPTRKCAALFCFLLLNKSRLHRRETLSEMFWPGLDFRGARRCLRTEFWRMHSIIEEGTQVPRGTHLISNRAHIGFKAESGVWLDTAEFETLLDTALPNAEPMLSQEKCRSLTRAISLYRGDFLEDLDYDWCLFERQRLKARVRSALEMLLIHYETNRKWESAINVCYQLLGQDALMEVAHRELMRCLQMIGNRSAALGQYEICSKLLEKELGVEPMVETISLWRKIKRGDCNELVDPAKNNRVTALVSSPSASMNTIDMALNELNDAVNRIEIARARLQRLIGDLSANLSLPPNES